MRLMTTNPYPRLPVLIIDDEDDILQSYRMALLLAKIDNFVLCNDSTKAMGLLKQREYSAIILDLTMPDISGQELLIKIKEFNPGIPVTVVTGSNRVNTAVECMKSGAYDYMVKPVDENRLISGLRNAIEIGELRQENLALKTVMLGAPLNSPDAFSGIVTVSENMRGIFRYIEAIATSPRPVLITGESGTGKELFGRAIHAASKRTGKFIAVNVGGLDDMLFSDTLFGHRKGAFTGAEGERGGLIEQAAGGTLFLDEIGVLEKNSQVKLLRLLQDCEYYPLGSDIVKTTDAVIVAATNENLDLRIKEGAFRNDLYFRLNTHHIHLPALRERPDDIAVLAVKLVLDAAKSLGKKCPEIGTDALARLRNYSFPGNVRELQSMVFDAVARCDKSILDASCFPALKPFQQNDSERNVSIFYTGSLPQLADVEEYFISEAMRMTNGNQTEAAALLGISQSTLSRRGKNRSL
jgi:DNA-binding NtrC family response regulator